MSDDFDKIFSTPTRRSFAERVSGQPLVPENEASPLLPRDLPTYEPYGYHAGGRADEGCTIYGWVDGTTVPTGTEFPWRLYMGLDFHDDTELRILLPHRIVIIQGNKLDELRRRLGRAALNFVMQYHPILWPNHHDGPTIRQIKIIRP